MWACGEFVNQALRVRFHLGSCPSRKSTICPAMVPAASRRLASLPMPKSKSRTSCDINLRNDTSHHPRHPRYRRGVRATATDSIHRVPCGAGARAPTNFRRLETLPGSAWTRHRWRDPFAGRMLRNWMRAEARGREISPRFEYSMMGEVLYR